MNRTTNQASPRTAEDVFRSIRNRILKLELEPGQKVSENQMCEEYGVSRSVIRVVFTRLCQLRLVNIYPQRGTYVSLMDLKFIEDLLLLRTAVEKEVMNKIFKEVHVQDRLELIADMEKNLMEQEKFRSSKSYVTAFKRLDSEFHKRMIDQVDLYNLVVLLEDQMIHITRWRNFTVTFDHQMPKLIDEHWAILNNLKAGNLLEMQEALADHLETISSIDEKAWVDFPQYFIR